MPAKRGVIRGTTGSKGVRAAAVVATFLVITAAACSSDDDDRRPASDGTMRSASQPDWLLVESAPSGLLEHTGSDTYRLTLQDPEDRAVAFTDRPYRKFKTVPVADVVNKVASAKDKVNAALQVESPKPATVVLELTNATYDPAVSTLVVDGRLIRGGSLADMSAEGKLPVGALSGPTLFVDGVALGSQDDGPSEALDVGSVCPITRGANNWCWTATPGGENWSPMSSSITVTYQNNGPYEFIISSAIPFIGCPTAFDRTAIQPGKQGLRPTTTRTRSASSPWLRRRRETTAQSRSPASSRIRSGVPRARGAHVSAGEAGDSPLVLRRQGVALPDGRWCERSRRRREVPLGS